MAFDFAQQRSRSNQYNEDLLAQAKASYKGEPGVGGVRGFNDFVKGSDGLRIGNVTSGTRNGIGSGNSNWMVNPDTGREERAFAGSDGLYYLESDLLKGFGSVANASKAMGAAHPEVDDRSPLSWSRAQQSNDTFSGKDGLQDLITIGSMAAVPWTAGAFGGLAGAGEAGAAGAGDAAIAGGVGTDALAGGAAGAGSYVGDLPLAADAGSAGAAATGAAPMGDWWTDLGMTAADVGQTAAPAGDWWSQYGLSASDVGANAASGGAASGGFDAASLLKQYGPLAARLAPGLLGAYASNKQAGALQNLAGQYQNYGGPSRARFEASMTPGFDPSSIPGYTGAVDTASKSLLARLSATGGNPYGNPGGLIDANKQIISGTALPAIQAYQNQNANVGFGGTLNAAGSFGGQAIGAQGNVYNAIGAGINDAVNPPQTLAQQLAELKKAGLYSPNGLQ